MDVRGYGADVRGYGADGRGYGADVRGYGVDVRGYDCGTIGTIVQLGGNCDVNSSYEAASVYTRGPKTGPETLDIAWSSKGPVLVLTKLTLVYRFIDLYQQLSGHWLLLLGMFLSLSVASSRQQLPQMNLQEHPHQQQPMPTQLLI